MTVKTIDGLRDPGDWSWVGQGFRLRDEKPTYYVETAIGRIGATNRGTVAIQPPESSKSEATHLTPDQVGILERALLYAHCTADQVGERLSGYNALRIRKIGDAYEGTWRGITVRLRRSVLRRARRCFECKQDVMALWIAVESPHAMYAPRTGFVETCDACVERLAAKPMGLRTVRA